MKPLFITGSLITQILFFGTGTEVNKKSVISLDGHFLDFYFVFNKFFLYAKLLYIIFVCLLRVEKMQLVRESINASIVYHCTTTATYVFSLFLSEILWTWRGDAGGTRYPLKAINGYICCRVSIPCCKNLDLAENVLVFQLHFRLQ